MTTPAKTVLIFCVAIGSFLAGAWWTRSSSAPPSATGARNVLCYHDPMHPAYKSDKPGVAPGCGMQLEPVYAGGGAGDPSSVSPAAESPGAGTVSVSSDKQQMIGVQVQEVRKGSGPQAIRVLGRAVADEMRTYKVNATIDGWIRQIQPVATTGSLVRKDETLASYNAPEFLDPMQAYLYALSSLDRFQATGKETEAQFAQTRASIQQAKNSLLTLGMSELQANEITKTRQLTEDIRIVAPADGFIVARNVSPGQRFEKGTEFFRVADLSHVWVMTDIFEKDRELARPGSSATVHYQGKTFRATMSNVLPQFDPTSRTLKARFELDNPGYVLRPDMFVDVEFQVNLPPSLTVPADAVIDSGMRKTIFVARGNGLFEPRAVETGYRLGDRVQITKGLEAGEQIVVSGTFLIDSESRMRLAAAGAAPVRVTADTTAKDPVCGMDVDPKKPGTFQAKHDGRNYTLCSPQCKQKFEADPEKYAPKKGDSGKQIAREKQEQRRPL